MENQNPPGEQNQPVTPAGLSGKKLIIIALVVLVGLFLIQSFFFSPERTAERMMERATGGDYDVSVDNDGSYNITSKDGESISIESGNKTEIPDNWPNSVPVPKGVDIEYAAVVGGEANETASTLNFSTTESLEGVNNFYKEQLVANGWTINSQIASGDGFMLTATLGEENFVSVYLTNTEGKTHVTISVQMTN